MSLLYFHREVSPLSQRGESTFTKRWVDLHREVSRLYFHREVSPLYFHREVSLLYFHREVSLLYSHRGESTFHGGTPWRCWVAAPDLRNNLSANGNSA